MSLLDRMSCAVALGIPGIALNDKAVGEVPPYVAEAQLTREASFLGFPASQLQPYITQGPLVEAASLRELGRFPVLTRCLGNKCKTTTAFLKVRTAPVAHYCLLWCCGACNACKGSRYLGSGLNMYVCVYRMHAGVPYVQGSCATS